VLTNSYFTREDGSGEKLILFIETAQLGYSLEVPLENDAVGMTAALTDLRRPGEGRKRKLLSK